MSTCAGLMLGQRRRRWPSITPTQDRCLVFARLPGSPSNFDEEWVKITRCSCSRDSGIISSIWLSAVVYNMDGMSLSRDQVVLSSADP